MGIGISVFLLVLGAIFRFAITADIDGVDLRMIGVILMIAGAGTFLLTILTMSRSNQQQQHNERLYNGDNPPSV
jgi:hypothetical protein